MTQAIIGLGANLGDPRKTFRRALEQLTLAGLGALRPSRLYSSAGIDAEGLFVNAAVLGDWLRSPQELLAVLLDIERLHGRVRSVANGPRVLDLDLLLFGRKVLDSEELELPHPRLSQRCFALAPLLDLLPEAIDPRSGTPYASFHRRLVATGIQAIEPIPWHPTTEQGQLQPSV